MKRVDENTICVVGVLGTSYNFQYDPIEEINNALVELKNQKGLDIPLHVHWLAPCAQSHAVLNVWT